MARNRMMLATVALAALGAKASAPDAPPAETTSAQADPRDATIAALAAENASLRARVEELNLARAMDRDEAQKRFEEQRNDANAAWKRYEDEIEERFRVMRESATPLIIPDGVLPPTAPVRGKVLRASMLLHAHTKGGARITVRAGDAIPEDIDLDGVDRAAIVEG